MYGGTVTPGLLLGERYELQRMLGRGGMGQVWEGRDLRLKRPVAVKVLSSAGPLEPRDLALFRREAEIGAMLSHPGITTVFDLGSPADDGRTPWYLVMERLVGRSFAKELARHSGGLPVERVTDLAGQVVSALGAAHAQGVVHRDIKPANLFLQESGLVKICDFGISRPANATHLLTGVQVAGTLPYMAPEQFASLAVDHRSDLYALGCVLYELLVGTTWVDPTTGWPGAMYQHHHVTPPSLAASRPDVPGDLDRLVLDLLAKAPADRPPDAAAVAARLQAIGREPRRKAGTDDRPRSERDAPTRLLTEAATGFRALYARQADQGADAAHQRHLARARRASAQVRAAGPSGGPARAEPGGATGHRTGPVTVTRSASAMLGDGGESWGRASPHVFHVPGGTRPRSIGRLAGWASAPSTR
ncbi:serine/threonine-protein kinase [Streptomyces adustus]|uniref:serine/threonine-protein kinase n=1 Tax=Streptomyces adustus TaxID=1609272 RepID=UPI00371BD545